MITSQTTEHHPRTYTHVPTNHHSIFLTFYTHTILHPHSSCVPRLPHHTAVAALGGSAARDAGWHFIGRWNLARCVSHTSLYTHILFVHRSTAFLPPPPNHSARHRARIARLKYQGTHPDVLLAASATGRFPSPPALAPHGVWRMATAMTTTGVSTALGGEPVEGAKPTGVSGGGGNAGAKGSGSAVLVRKVGGGPCVLFIMDVSHKQGATSSRFLFPSTTHQSPFNNNRCKQTVARLVFGAHSSVAPPPPPPETDGLLTPAEAARKDLLTEVEEAASSKAGAS